MIHAIPVLNSLHSFPMPLIRHSVNLQPDGTLLVQVTLDRPEWGGSMYVIHHASKSHTA